MTDWLDGIEWSTLDDNAIVQKLIANKEKVGEAEIHRILDKLSVEGNNSNTTVLYSGLGNDTGAFISEKRAAGYRIIDDTQAGKLLASDGFKDFLINELEVKNVDDFLYNGQNGAWARISKRFVETSTGEVQIYLGTNPNSKGVFNQTELMAVLKTEGIHTVNEMAKSDFATAAHLTADMVPDEKTLNSVKKVLENSTKFLYSPAFQKAVKKFGFTGTAIGLATVSASAQAAIEAGDTEGAVKTIYKYISSELGGALSGALFAQIAVRALTTMAVKNPYVFLATSFLSAILGALKGSEAGEAFAEYTEESIAKFIKDCCDWFTSDKERLRDEIGSDFTTASETRSPLVVDLDGDGVETVSVEEGVYFDHDGNGFSEKTGWVSGDDGILVRDLNDNGQIDDGSELFGDQTVLSNGEKASNGFEALADLDSNHDGVFDGDDEAFGEVMVWQDKNGNGIVDDGELMTLNEAGITSITLDYENQSITDINGNGHNQTGTFVKTDGTNGTITDVWL